MKTTPYVDAMLDDLAGAAAVGDQALADAAERLGNALRGSARLRLLDLLGEAAVEISEQLPAGHVEVRLAGQEPSLVYVEEAIAAPPPSAAPDDAGARITLRLPDALKTTVETAAAQEGLSVNAWIVRALARASNPPTVRTRRRLTGFAQS